MFSAIMRLCLAISISMVFASQSIAHDIDGESHPSNDVQILKPPAPDYPLLAQDAGMIGLCEVHFSLKNYGDTLEIEHLKCTHPVFCPTSYTAVRNARFKVIDVEGSPHPGERTDNIYPLEYVFGGMEGLPEGAPPLRLCKASPIS